MCIVQILKYFTTIDGKHNQYLQIVYDEAFQVHMSSTEHIQTTHCR